MGAKPEQIIFANPCKAPSFIRFAKENSVSKMTFDNFDELVKIKAYFPAADLVIRIHVDDSHSVCQLGTKFGVRLGNTKALMKQAKSLDLKIMGISFHVGSSCQDAIAYKSAIQRAKEVYEEALEVGFHISLLDIGGGFPGVSGKNNEPCDGK